MELQKVSGAKVWTPESLDRVLWDQSLTTNEQDELKAALEALPASIEEIRQRPPQLPLLERRLQQIEAQLRSGPGLLRLSGFPEGDDDALARMFFAIGKLLGTPVSQSAKGEAIFRVADAGYAADHPAARGPNTQRELSFHTDRCDMIGFWCVRQAQSGGENLIVSSPQVYNHILEHRPDLLEVLCQPFYYKTHNVDVANPLPYCKQPIFSHSNGVFIANVLQVLILRAYALEELPDLTSVQREALAYLQEVSNLYALEVKLAAGDVLWMNNWTTFHSRKAFVDQSNPGRLYLRLWLSMANGPQLPETFRDFYGDYRAGALRGGIHPASGRLYFT
jgi:alpha-ketoglutarate-dependent taurine dioxygenase